MGDKIYYYRKDKKNRKRYLVRRAPETVVQTSATKHAAIDFGTASKTSGLIRKALHAYTNDTTLHYRLNQKMGEILRADLTHPSGQRVITPENMQALRGFRFNGEAGMAYNAVIENNDINISFPATCRNKNNTTHITIKAIALSVNLTKSTTQITETNTILIKHGEKPAPLTINLNRRNLTLIILEIQSWYEVNGVLHKSLNRKAQTLDVIDVLAPVQTPAIQRRKNRNTIPRFWLPYARTTKPALIILPFIYSSPPKD